MVPALRGADLLADAVAALLRGVRDLLPVLLRGLLGGLLDVLLGLLDMVLGRGGDLLGDLLAVVERLLAGLLDLLLGLVGDRAELLVLDVRRGDQHPREEADRDGAHGEAEGVLLRDAGALASGLLDVTRAGRRLVDRAGGTG